MADSYTPNYNFIRPEPGGSVDTWGLKLNSNWGDIDTILHALQQNVDTVVDDALLRANNFSDVADPITARSNLGLGSAATQSDNRYTHRTNNLSDLQSAAEARTNLGLGSAAQLAATAVAQTANNLSDVASVSQARANLGLGTAATEADTKYVHRASNLGDLNNVATARTNLGLGSAATQADNRYAHRSSNLSDLSNAATARTNLGLGDAATAGLTDSRTSSSSSTALSAAGMNSHRTSGDHDARYLRKDTSQTLSGNLTVTGNITAYSSDARLKEVLENLDELPDLMGRLSRIQTVLYAWDEDACEEACFSPDKDVELGVLAQEVRAVFPELVSAAPFNEDYLTVDYARLSVVALAGVKQLSAEIEGIKAALKRRGL